jgi:hypothetical protein
MEEKKNWLRGVDFYCGIGIMIFGAFVVFEGFGMPSKIPGAASRTSGTSRPPCRPFSSAWV